jgi:5-methylcytosine-specific restriction endonuclease McrA
MAKPIPKKLIKAILERDNGICQYCGNRGVNIHHIIPAGLGGKRKHLIENLITLCGECHMGVHSSKEMRDWTYTWSRQRYGNAIDRLLAEKWSNKKDDTMQDLQIERQIEAERRGG